ncbi:MAG: DUF3874 domain-containing protein [Prevotella sp.]|nr:DUF3874 domain-containing protein [Prevotella sp.]
MKLTLVLRDKKHQLKLSTRTLDNFIERIKTDTKDGAVTRRRQHLGDGRFIDSYDSQYPSHVVYPSAVFDKDDNDNLRMKKFNGVVALTVDGLEGQDDIDAVKRAARILHYTLAAFVGPSEHEVVILVKIVRDDSASVILQEKPELLREKSEILQEYSAITQPHREIGVTSLPTEEEADALCREGHRMATAIYQGILPKPIRLEAATVRSSFRLPLDDAPYYNPKAMALPVSPKPTLVDHGDGSVDHGRLTTTDLENYDQEVSRQTQQLMDFLNTHYQFRYNCMMDCTEYKDRSHPYLEWAPVDDRTLKGMTMKVRLAGIDARDNDVRRYVHSDMHLRYNPVIDYLWARYGQWDGKDHIRRLARTVPTKNPHWVDWFYTWFLGMVHQWQESNRAKYGNQSVPLLISAQGWNKTTFCEQLIPPELRFGYTGNLQMDDKRQVLQQMAQMLLINLDEFNQISPKTQQGFLKNIITLSSVKIKRPYGRHVENFPRRASFIATTNQADVLADPSGSRRFLGVELAGPIDVSTPPNYDQLYAQAMQALYHDEPYYFDSSASAEIIEWNKRFSVKTAADQFFLDYFEPAVDETEGEWISASAIFNFLKQKVGISLLKPANVATFGRRLSNMPNLKKRVTRANSEYLLKRKKA